MSVCNASFRRIGWTDFSEILHGDEESKNKKNYRARFSILDFNFDFKDFRGRKWPFFVYFGNYLKNGTKDFVDFLIYCSPLCCTPFKKNRMSGKNLVPEL